MGNDADASNWAREATVLGSKHSGPDLVALCLLLWEFREVDHAAGVDQVGIDDGRIILFDEVDQ